jgi:hypothetical protein
VIVYTNLWEWERAPSSANHKSLFWYFSLWMLDECVIWMKDKDESSGWTMLRGPVYTKLTC